MCTKGAVEEILHVCTSVHQPGISGICSGNGTATPLTAELRQRALAMAQAFDQDGLRVIAVAVKIVSTRFLLLFSFSSCPVQAFADVFDVCVFSF
jgi:magnesium-transporting ATPase (P-type)